MINFKLQTSNFERGWPSASFISSKLIRHRLCSAVDMPLAPRGVPPHRAFRFACGIVHLYTKLASTSGVPSHLARQILRAGTSIGANLEEARGAQTRRDVTAKFSIALKEARETAYWLRLLDSAGLAPQELIHPIFQKRNNSPRS